MDDKIDDELEDIHSKLISESNRVFSYHSVALEDTRSIIDSQMEQIQEADKETLKMIRINLVLLGSFVPIIISSPGILGSILPWALLSGVFSVASVMVASYIYRGWVLYAGFSDSPHFTFDSLVESYTNAENIDLNNPQTVTELDSPIIPLDEFQTLLIKDHELGILHNNVEIKYRNEIHQQTTLLLLMSVVMFVLGILTIPTSNRYFSYVIFSLAVIVFILGTFRIIKALGLIARFELRAEDEERLSWGHGFEREYPYMTVIYKIILKIYDPEEE